MLKFTIKLKTIVPTKNVLTVCSIPNFIKTDVLNTLIKKEIEQNAEYIKDMGKTMTIEPSKAEWMIYKSIPNSKIVSSGHNPLDIIYNNIGIDVAVLSLSDNTNISNEKSIIQDFKGCGNNLDQLFDKKLFTNIVDLYKESLFNKLNKSFTKYKLENIYYIIFLCTNTSINILTFNLHLNVIKCIEFDTIFDKSITIKNFIDSKLGNCKIKKKNGIEIK